MTAPTFILPSESSEEARCWMGRPLRESLRAEFKRAGLREGDSADCITCTELTAVSAEAIVACLKQTSGRPGDLRAVLGGEVGRWSKEAAFGPAAALYRLRGGGALTASRVEAATSIELSVDTRVFEVPTADQAGGRALTVPLSNAVLCSVQTPCGLLWANLLYLGPTLWAELMGRHPVSVALSMAYGVLRARSFDPICVGAVLSRVESDARVHPSAVVEGSWIQSGATIGPGAVVRGSIIGPGARVEAHALADFCVMAEDSCIQRGGIARFSLFHDGASHAGAMQLSVLGPRASVKVGAYLMDQSLEQNVRVMTDSGPVLAPFGLMGVAIGAGSFVGSGVWIAPGRVVPEGVSLVPSPKNVLSRMPPANAGCVFVGEE